MQQNKDFFADDKEYLKPQTFAMHASVKFKMQRFRGFLDDY